MLANFLFYKLPGLFKEILQDAPGNMSGLGKQLYSMMNSITKANLTGAEIQQNQFNADQASLAYNRERDLMRDSASLQVEGAQRAGINPVFAVSGSAGAPSSPQASAAGSSAGGFSMSDLLQLMMLPKTLKAMDAQIDLTRANADKSSADASLARQTEQNTAYDLQFLRSVESYRIESQELYNSLSRTQINKLNQDIDESLGRISLMAKQEDTEASKFAANMAQAALADASAKQICEMLPYNKLLAEAQTDNQKAAAALSWLNAAYQQKLIDSGYIDEFVKLMRSQARSADASATVAEIAASIRSGNFHPESDNKALNFLYSLGGEFLAGIANVLDLLPLGFSVSSSAVSGPRH